MSFPFSMCSSICNRREFLRAVGLGSAAAMLSSRFAGATDAIAPPRFLLQWGEHGDGEGEFDSCVGIAIGPDDVIHTSEFRNKRVQRFSLDGKFLSQFPVRSTPGGLAVDPQGNVYVGFWNDNIVAAYAPDGKPIREWGQKGTGDGEFRLPGSIAFGPDGLLYVPDQGNSRVQKFTTEGAFVGKWGEHGSEPGQFGGSVGEGSRFAGPQFVSFDRDGNIYTTDAALDRVQKFSPDGKFLKMWGSESDQPGGFGPLPLNKNGTPGPGGPIALCVDAENRVWVSATNSRVQLFSNEGEYLCGLGGLGTEAGQFELPHGITLDRHGNLYVVDTMNYRIQKFGW